MSLSSCAAASQIVTITEGQKQGSSCLICKKFKHFSSCLSPAEAKCKLVYLILMWGCSFLHHKKPTKPKPATTNKQKTQTTNPYTFPAPQLQHASEMSFSSLKENRSYQFCAVLFSCSSDPQAKCSLQEAAAGNAKLSVNA